MRHGEPAQRHFVSLHVDDDTAVAPVLAPAVGEVAFPDGGNESGEAIAHGEPVEVAAVLARKLAQERGFPERPEAVGLAHGGEASEQRILTKITRPAPSSAISWMSRSPVT